MVGLVKGQDVTGFEEHRLEDKDIGHLKARLLVEGMVFHALGEGGGSGVVGTMPLVWMSLWTVESNRYLS